MAREIPEVVRAAAGLAATVLDEARKLPETLPGLPVRFIGLAMQQAMKAQQTYAGFVARGDELFTGFRGEDEPGLATFDDEDDEPLPAPGGFRESAFDRAGDTEPTSAGPDTEGILDEIAIDELVDQAPTLAETAPAAGEVTVGEPASAGNSAVPPASATAPIDGYDSFSLAQLRGRMRGYALSTVRDLLSYERATRARTPYLTMLRNRLEKLEEQAVESSPLAPRGA